MVTDNQFYQAVRSCCYRKRLSDNLNELEQKIVDYLSEKNLTTIALPGYSVEMQDGGIIIEERPIEDLNQLYLTLGD